MTIFYQLIKITKRILIAFLYICREELTAIKKKQMIHCESLNDKKYK